MKADTLLVAAAPVEDSVAYIETIGEAFMVIAVDGGVDLCRAAGRLPDVVIGDLDSASAPAIAWARDAGVEVRDLTVAKDYSDLDAALEYAGEHGLRPVTVTAALSGRLDHTLSNVGSLLRLARLAPRVWEPCVDGWVLAPHGMSALAITGRGRTVSIQAGLAEASVTLEGFRYPLSEAVLPPLSSLGLSNVIEADTGEIIVHSGSVLVLAWRETPGQLRIFG